LPRTTPRAPPGRTPPHTRHAQAPSRRSKPVHLLSTRDAPSMYFPRTPRHRAAPSPPRTRPARCKRIRSVPASTRTTHHARDVQRASVAELRIEKSSGRTVPVRARRPLGCGEDAPPRHGGGSSACRSRAGSSCTATAAASCRCDTSAACAYSSRRQPTADVFSRLALAPSGAASGATELADAPEQARRSLRDSGRDGPGETVQDRLAGQADVEHSLGG